MFSYFKKHCDETQVLPNLHSCGYCVMSFHSENKLKMHIATVHPEVVSVLLPTKQKNFL